MRSLIVVESMFGNTRKVAEAVADGLAPSVLAEVVDVGGAPAVIPTTIDLLLVGGPTHAFGMTRPGTRSAAVDQGAEGPVGPGVREWLAGLPPTDAPVPAAAFDTRVPVRLLPGSAARGIARRLHRLGLVVLGSPESFWVTATPGPLGEGELARARAWGHDLARQLTERTGTELRSGT